MKTREEVVHAFTPVNPKEISPVQQQAILIMQTEHVDLATTIFKDVPECADRTVALRKLLECKMYCIQAITHTGFFKPDTKKDKPNDSQKKQNETAKVEVGTAKQAD